MHERGDRICLRTGMAAGRQAGWKIDLIRIVTTWKERGIANKENINSDISTIVIICTPFRSSLSSVHTCRMTKSRGVLLASFRFWIILMEFPINKTANWIQTQWRFIPRKFNVVPGNKCRGEEIELRRRRRGTMTKVGMCWILIFYYCQTVVDVVWFSIIGCDCDNFGLQARLSAEPWATAIAGHKKAENATTFAGAWFHPMQPLALESNKNRIIVGL